MSGNVWVIDEDEQRRTYLQHVLEFIDYRSLHIGTREAWEQHRATAGEVQAVLIGNCHGEAEAVAAVLRAAEPNLPVLLIGEGGRSEPLEKNVFGRLEVPVKYHQLAHALRQASMYREGQASSKKGRPLELFRSLVGNSRAIVGVRRMIEQVADTDTNVLIFGESGTGKEVAARHLHYRSARRPRPFVPMNCGAIPPDLLDSELFGREKDASGAARQGRFELAEGGTLFLDEIGDLSLPTQVKLLRVLQERTFERVGSSKSMTADVRIIAATHCNLEEAIREGRFREDLYYRLNVFPIEMPPLRSRADDVPLLIHELVTRLAHEGRGALRLSPGAVVCLTQYAWPGNVRELANLMERLAILHPGGVIDIADLPEKYRAGVPVPPPSSEPAATTTPMPLDTRSLPRLPPEGLDLKEHMNSVEYALIRQALEESGGVVARAAKRLKLGRTTLVEKLRKYEGGRVEATSGV